MTPRKEYRLIACGAREITQLMRDHYLLSPDRFPLAYYRMKAIAHRYELLAVGDNLFYKGNQVWSFAFRGEIQPDQLDGVDMLVIPEVEAHRQIRGFELIGSGYRLFHRTFDLACPAVKGIEIIEASPIQEATEIASVLNRCYAVNTFTPGTIIEGTKGEAYCPYLWLWAVDTTNGAKAGIFITDVDPEIREANLDWIQLLPEYRGKRIGEALISETLSRLRGKADMAYVGTLDERAARFYRKCGFDGCKSFNFRRIGTKLLSYHDACKDAP
jgi:ribosomal protein S18 acetylase RimI-like enzyme